jgi:transposase
VGAVTALATEVFLGDPNRFDTGNQVASYIGMIPCEHSSGKRQRLGKLSKEGNSLLRYLWTEATMHAVGKDPELNASIGASSSRKEWAKPGSQRPANWGSGCGS